MRENQDTHEDGPQIITALAELPPGSFVFESDLARIFGKCQMSIKRAVERGELPRPARFMGRPMWTSNAIIEHVENLLDRAKQEHKRVMRRVEQMQGEV